MATATIKAISDWPAQAALPPAGGAEACGLAPTRTITRNRAAPRQIRASCSAATGPR